MRTTNQIICAVKDCEPVTEEELRLALVAMSSIEHFLRTDLQRLIEAIVGDRSRMLLQSKANFAAGTIEVTRGAIKMPPDQWLSPDDIPGTPENKARMKRCRKIYRAATGEDL